MVDFSHLMSKRAGQALKPQALPAGQYGGTIVSFSTGDDNKNKTPYVRFQIKLTSWPDSVPEADRFMRDKDGRPTDKPVDLQKKQLRRDFYLTDDALHRLDDLCRSCGLGQQLESGESYEMVLPNIVGASVVAEVAAQVSDRSGEMINFINGLAGQG